MSNHRGLGLLLFIMIFQCEAAVPRLKVSVVMPASGYFSKMGTAIYQGILTSMEIYPELKSGIDLRWVPSTESISTLASDTEKNIVSFSPDLIVGGVTSLQAMTMGQISEKHNVPFLAPYATHPSLTEGHREIFTLCFDDRHQARGFAGLVAELKLNEVAVLYSKGDLYSEYLKDNFIQFAKERGIHIAENIGIDPALPPDEKLLEHLAEKKYKTYFLPFYQMSARTLLKQLFKITPEQSTFLGTDAWAVDSAFVQEFKSSGGSRRAIYVDHWNSEATTALHKVFKSQIHGRLISGTALGFDVGLLLKALLKMKRTGDLAQNMENISFQGLSGRTRYNHRNSPQKDMHFFQIDSTGSHFLRSLRTL